MRVFIANPRQTPIWVRLPAIRGRSAMAESFQAVARARRHRCGQGLSLQTVARGHRSREQSAQLSDFRLNHDPIRLDRIMVRLEMEASSCHLACFVSRQTSPTDVGSYGVDRACRRDADVSHKCHTTIAITSHAPILAIDIRRGNPVEVGVAFRGETRPLRRERATRTASLTL